MRGEPGLVRGLLGQVFCNCIDQWCRESPFQDAVRNLTLALSISGNLVLAEKIRQRPNEVDLNVSKGLEQGIC